MVRFLLHSSVFGLWCAVAFSAARTASAAPLGDSSDARTALAMQVTDELKASAPGILDPQLAEMFLHFGARFDFLLGRRSACEKYLKQRETEVAEFADSKRRLNALRHLAETWAGIDPVQSRRLLAQIERETPKDPSMTAAVANVYFELDDFRSALKAAESAAKEDPDSVTGTYEIMGRFCFTNDKSETLTELRSRVREYRPGWGAVDPKLQVGILYEYERIRLLAACGLADEAASLYERNAATDGHDPLNAGAIGCVGWSYSKLGDKEKARKFIRKHLPRLEPDARRFVAVAAAEARDYELVDVILSETSSAGAIDEFPALIITAHRNGDSSVRDAWLSRYREAVGRTPEKTPTEYRRVNLAYVVPATEAAIGRYDAAVSLLPQLTGIRGCAFRMLLVESLLREQGKQFGRNTHHRAAALCLDVHP